jgi:hypothetical protein
VHHRGEQISLDRPGAPANADVAAARVQRPRRLAADDPVDRLTFPTPEAAAGRGAQGVLDPGAHDELGHRAHRPRRLAQRQDRRAEDPSRRSSTTTSTRRRKLTVNKGSTITWVWPDEALDVHDVKLSKGPKGVTKFQSDLGAAGFKYKRTLKVPGTYKIVCTLHEEMTMTIRVRP